MMLIFSWAITLQVSRVTERWTMLSCWMYLLLLCQLLISLMIPVYIMFEDSFESVTSSALHAVGLRLYAIDDDDAMSAASSSPIRAPTPPHVPDHVPDPDLVPFGLPFVAPLIPDPVSAPLDLPSVVPQPLNVELQFEMLSRRVLELEFGEGARRSPFPLHPTSIPPPSLLSSFVLPPAAPTSIPGFGAHFLTAEQQISYLLRRVHELEEELAHVRRLIFFPPPPPPSAS
ncbi:hypothetical protein Hanom_Chr04g00332641 [Helianthus anomalus]